MVSGTRAYVVTDAGELWITDGSGPGSFALTPADCTLPFPPVLAGLPGGGAAFAGSTMTTGVEPWLTDGTPASTRLAIDLENTRGTNGSTPELLGRVGTRAVFSAIESSTPALWSTKGSAATTHRIADLPPSGRPQFLVALPDALLLTTDHLIRTDGTSAGTRDLATLAVVRGNPRGDAALLPDGRAVFLAWSGSQLGLWTSDGTTAGTVQVVPWPSGRVYPTRLVAAAGAVFFWADDGTNAGIWRTDGTRTGTVLVVRTSGWPTPDPELLGGLDDKVLFATHVGSVTTLWVWDGSGAGTTILLQTAWTRTPVRVRDRLVFMVSDGVVATDGTPTGTGRLPVAGFPVRVIGGNDFAIVVTQSSVTTTLYRTDGTPGGTVRLAFGAPLGQIDPPFALSDQRVVIPIQSSATPPTTAFVVTDGTTAGTGLLHAAAHQYRAGTLATTMVDGSLLFPQWEAHTGVELWALDLGPTALGEGSACSLSPREFTLTALDPPRLGGTARLRATFGGAPTALVLGEAATTTFPGRTPCALYVDPLRPVWTLALGSAGAADLPLPDQTVLRGVVLGAQAVATTPAPGIALSNGLRLRLDR